jgi:hypothetical protein
MNGEETNEKREEIIEDLMDLRDSIAGARLRVASRVLDIFSNTRSSWYEVPREDRSRDKRRELARSAIKQITDTIEDEVVPSGKGD